MTRAPAPDDSHGLIGALLAIPNFELQRRVQVGFAAAGLPEMRPANDAIFRWPPAEGADAQELSFAWMMIRILVADVAAGDAPRQ